MQRDPWSTTWMNVAREIATRSKDPSTQVGAVLVDWTLKKFLGMGFNGPPPEIHDDFDWSDRPLKHSLVFHAESNCLWFAADAHGIESLWKGVLFVTAKPCHRCTLECVRARLSTVVWDDRGKQPRMCDEAEWAKSTDVARRGALILQPFSDLSAATTTGTST